VNATFTGNTITGHADGFWIEAQAGYTATVNATGNSIFGNSVSGATATGSGTHSATMEDNWWGSANGPQHASNTFNVGFQGNAVSDSVDFVPWLDDAPPDGASFAPVTTTTNPADSYASIQAGVNASDAGATVNAKAGTFTENVTIAKGVTVAGAGQGATIVIPAVSKPNPCAGGSLCGSANAASNLFLVQASDVTIRNLTADGDNPTLTSGIVRGGADLDARNGIVEDYYAGVYDNLQVHDVTVKNIYLRGIYASSGGTGFDFHDNTVQNVQGESQSIGIMNYGGSGAISDNSVSDCNDAIAANYSQGTQFIGNSVTNSGSGIHTDNNGGMGGVGDLIQGNTVTDSTLYGYGIWTFVPYVPITVQNNTISGVDVGLAASGQAAPVSTSFVNNQVTGKPGSTGVYVTTDEFGWGSGNVSATFTGNTITGHADGFWIEAQAGYTATVNATGNSIFGNSVSGATTTGDGTSGLVFRLNQIAGNGTYGIDNTTSNVVDALSNWWGDVTGPLHPTKNPTGQGNKISDYVLFDPWLKAIEYVGDTSIPSGSTANLRARFLNSSGTTPLVAGATVHFDLLDSLGNKVSGSPFSALTDGSGVASVPVTGLGIGFYTVTARWDPLEDSTNLTVSGPGDSDGDGVLDGEDNCPAVYNPDQKNSDGGRRPNGSQIPGEWASNPAQDKLGDACDPDDDNDGLPDTSENDASCPYRLVADSDGDTVLDGYEVANGYDPCNAASRPTWEGGGDSDGDGIPDGVERTGYNTCIFAGDTTPGYTTCAPPTDSDGDGCADWIEIVDVNGSRQANIVDVLLVAKRALDIIPASDSDYVLDINKNGAVNIVDVLLAAKNSTLARPHSTCLPE
jgi:hypothetical protein